MRSLLRLWLRAGEHKINGEYVELNEISPSAGAGGEML